MMKEHLRKRYEKYTSYTDVDLERSIYNFLNEYVEEMKNNEQKKNEAAQAMDAETTEYGSFIKQNT